MTFRDLLKVLRNYEVSKIINSEDIQVLLVCKDEYYPIYLTSGYGFEVSNGKIELSKNSLNKGLSGLITNLIESDVDLINDELVATFEVKNNKDLEFKTIKCRLKSFDIPAFMLVVTCEETE